jgi:3-phosphoshikimate 1-carboxyvinyltransferase
MKLQCDIQLPASKSESNRALMIAAYGGFAPDFKNLSDSNDTLLIYRVLESMPSSVIDVSDCGTAARFLTTYLACREGDWLLTGTERMQQRPIKPLVDALLTLGADIQYVDKQGFLPLRIKGKPLVGGKVSLDMSQSSQYASSLLLAAPMFPQGLEAELLGNLSSLPYLEMTLAMMRHFGAEVDREGRTVIVKPKPYQSTSFTVSADWTAASYWYEMAAFSEDCEMRLKGLSHCPNLQGDSIIAEWMQSLGVETSVEEDTLVLRKRPFEKRPIRFDFSQNPDLYPTMAATCAGLGIEATFTGLDNLHLKESDRVEAMETELAKISEQPDGKPLCFCAHNDHRVVMALAPLAMLYGPVSFDHPEVVGKSYPRFWDDVPFKLLSIIP